MDVLTYSWLTSNAILDNNEQSSSSSSSSSSSCNKLIDSLLILSSNNILISINNLIQYCTTTTAATTTHLNNKQFQILNDSINSYCNTKPSDTTTTTTDNHDDNSTLIINHNNIINSNNTKFDCSIILIIENNKQILNYSSNNNTAAATIVVENKKRKISHQIDYTTTIKVNNSKIKNNDNDSLFYRIWRNVVIRNEILLHVRLYNIHTKPILVSDVVNELPNYKLNGYLKSIHIDSNFKLRKNSLPYGLEYISFSYRFNQLMVKDMIPDTVKTIEFNNDSQFNQTLDGNWLPPSLTSLTFGKSFQQPIKVGHLPNSLTNLELRNNEDYEGIIEHGALPKSLIVNDKHEFGFYKFNSNIKLTNDSIPKSTTKLVFDNQFDQAIKKGDIPHNVTSLKMTSYEIEIKPFVLPPSITDLNLRFSLFNPIENVLPPNLTSLSISDFALQPTDRILPESITTLTLGCVLEEIDAVSLLPNLTKLEIGELILSFQQVPRLFPQSLTSISIRNSFDDTPPGFFINHTNLKTLIAFAPQTLTSTLPPSITHLELDFSEEPNENQYPLHDLSTLKSLTNLKLVGNFDSTINLGDLPSSLTSLTLSEEFNQPINNGVLPNNLKELYLLNPSFNQYIPTDDNNNQLLPTSLQSIIISPENHKFLNNLNLNFILKYIKFNKHNRFLI